MPYSIKEIGFCDFNDWSYHIDIHGHYVFIGDWMGLRIIDISNPTSPKDIGHFWPETIIEDVDVAGHYAFLANSSDGLLIVDISDPTSPFEVGYYDYETTGGWAEEVRVIGNYAYLLDEDGSLYKVDISSLKEVK